MRGQKKVKKIKNKKALFAGIFTGFITILFLGELFQILLAFVAGTENIHLKFLITGLKSEFILPEQLNNVISAIIYLGTEILLILLFEIGIIFLKRTGVGIARFSLIVFEIIIIGFLIVDVFYGAIRVLLRMEGNDWIDLVNRLDLSFEGGIVFMFFVIITFIIYLNFSSKRIMNYINV